MAGEPCPGSGRYLRASYQISEGWAIYYVTHNGKDYYSCEVCGRYYTITKDNRVRKHQAPVAGEGAR